MQIGGHWGRDSKGNRIFNNAGGQIIYNEANSKAENAAIWRSVSGAGSGGGGSGGGSGKAKVSEETFWNAFDRKEGGRFYVKIHELRDELNWSRDQFDRMLESLRDRGVLQLQDGDTDYFTYKNIEDSYVDENGFRFLTVMRRKQ
jgi:hypothetical protein